MRPFSNSMDSNNAPPSPWNHCADHLVSQTIRIDNRATLEGFDQPHDTDGARSTIDGHFGAGGHVAALFVSDGEAESLAFACFLWWPGKRLCRRLEDTAQPGIGEILPAKLERIHLRRAGQIIYVGLASKVVRGCRQASI